MRAHPFAYLRDPRSNLYLRFLEYVRVLRPLVVLMENVPDSLNYGGHNIAQEVAETLNDLGYSARYTLLNSALYGVPQLRERMFLLAYATTLRAEVRFPKPFRWISFPKGYEGTRKVAVKNLEQSLFNKDQLYYITPPPASERLLPAVTAKEALDDLPKITDHLRGKMKKGARRLDLPVPYPDRPFHSCYAQLMRNWPGFSTKDVVTAHVIRSLPRDYRIFARMKAGDQYPEAYMIAERILSTKLAMLNRRDGRLSREAVESLRRQIVPPYSPSKFPNKWRKMEADYPARTLMAHIGKDSYSHIHYDSRQARTISVREAARLQSFPDGFQFSGSMNDGFRQVGNAVPPLLSFAIAREVKRVLISNGYRQTMTDTEKSILGFLEGEGADGRE